MSAELEAKEVVERCCAANCGVKEICANCGKAEIDDIKLKDCDKCDLARYCGDECKQNHREIHEESCKVRAAELRDEILFRQPESSSLGDCQICFLPLPLDGDKSVVSSCCGKTICKGCAYANQIREFEERLKHRCAFCRKLIPVTDNDEEIKRNFEKRVAQNDPIALRNIGWIKYKEGDYERAFEYSARAAELGDVGAHCNLSLMYRRGDGVEKDEEKRVYHAEEAAIAGDPHARFDLALYESQNKRYERAVKHWIIAANLGHDMAIRTLKECYKVGQVSKDDLAGALRAHQAAVDAMKSPQREEAAKYLAAKKHQYRDRIDAERPLSIQPPSCCCSPPAPLVLCALLENFDAWNHLSFQMSPAIKPHL